MTVNYATGNGTAIAPGDYATQSGTLTFAPGVTSQPITVAVVGDTTVEPDESFLVNLSGPSSNATIIDNQGQGTIVNDDQTPPPATVTLSPLGATNNVGTEHCTTATVRDAAGNLMRDVVVRFSVSGPNATNGSDTTGANGEAAFCYTGTSAGEDTIRAFADTNGDGTPGAGEPSAQTTKRWIEQPTQPVPCEIEGKGRLDINGKKATFKIDVESGPMPEGKVRFKDYGSAPPLDLRSTEITQVDVTNDGTEATILGKATVNGVGSLDFRVDLKDVPRAPDTFRIRVGDLRLGGADVPRRCRHRVRVRGAGRRRDATRRASTVDVQTTPAGGKVWFRDRGSARSFTLRSTSITSV